MDDRRLRGTSEPEADQKYPDVYARYRNGVHELSIGAIARSESRFVVTLAFFGATFVAVVLALTGYGFYSALVACLMAPCAYMALVRKDAKNREEPANESSLDGTGSTSQSTAGGIEGGGRS